MSKESSENIRQSTSSQSSFFPDFGLKREKRRDAVRLPKIKQVIGHQFRRKFFSQPTFCSVCGDFLWGFGKQGYQCAECGCAIHDRCLEKVSDKCFGNHSFTMEVYIYMVVVF